MIKKNTLKTAVKNILLFIPFIDFQEYVVGDTIENALKIYFLASCFFMIASALKNKALSKKNLLYAIAGASPFYIPFIIAVLSNYGESILVGTKMMLGIIAIVLYFASEFKTKSKEMFLSITILFGLMSIINTLTFYFFYPSMDPNNKYFYFLGVDNGSIYEIELFIITMIYYFEKTRKKQPFFVYLIIAFILSGYAFVFSGNGMIFTSILLVLSIAYKKIPQTIINYLVIGYIIATIAMVFSTNSEIIAPILESLGKSSTISGRTSIWKRTFFYIEKEPLFGNGLEPFWMTVEKLRINRPHNFSLQLLYNGGIYMFVVSYAILVRIYRNLLKSNLSNPEKVILSMGIIIFLYISLVDFYLYRFAAPIMFAIIFFESKYAPSAS